jgi:hypothetical protein
MKKMQDELLWAAAWLYTATRGQMYLKYIQEESISAVVAEFSWDLKYAGAQILLSEVSSNLSSSLSQKYKHFETFSLILACTYDLTYILLHPPRTSNICCSCFLKERRASKPSRNKLTVSYVQSFLIAPITKFTSLQVRTLSLFLSLSRTP